MNSNKFTEPSCWLGRPMERGVSEVLATLPASPRISHDPRETPLSFCTYLFHRFSLCKRREMNKSLLKNTYILIILLSVPLWPPWVFVAAWAFLCLRGARAPIWLRCLGLSLQRLLLLQSTGSGRVGFSACSVGLLSCSSWALQHRLSICGAQA